MFKEQNKMMNKDTKMQKYTFIKYTKKQEKLIKENQPKYMMKTIKLN